MNSPAAFFIPRCRSNSFLPQTKKVPFQLPNKTKQVCFFQSDDNNNDMKIDGNNGDKKSDNDGDNNNNLPPTLAHTVIANRYFHSPQAEVVRGESRSIFFLVHRSRRQQRARRRKSNPRPQPPPLQSLPVVLSLLSRLRGRMNIFSNLISIKFVFESTCTCEGP